MSRLHRSLSADVKFDNYQIQRKDGGDNILIWWNNLNGYEQQKWLNTFISHAKFSDSSPDFKFSPWKPSFTKKDRSTLFEEDSNLFPKRRNSSPNLESFKSLEMDDFDSKCSTPVHNIRVDSVKPSPYIDRNNRRTFFSKEDLFKSISSDYH